MKRHVGFYLLILFEVVVVLSGGEDAWLRMEPDVMNPMRSVSGLTQLPLQYPREVHVASGHSHISRICESFSISSPKRPDSERLYGERNYSGQGHSRDTLLQILPSESNCAICAVVVHGSSLPSGTLGGSAQRPSVGTAVHACIACKAVKKKTLFFMLKNDP